MLPDFLFQSYTYIIRAFHVAGRCTDCGECSRVCPQGIPLHLFNRKFIKDIDTFYGEYKAGADAESKGPLTSFTFDDVEPGVGTHGDYPKTPVIANPVYTVSGVDDEEKKNQWTYYINQLNEVDTFMNDLITELSKRDEDTIVVAFGDHLPTMGLEDSDMKSGDIYKTKYVTNSLFLIADSNLFSSKRSCICFCFIFSVL